MSHLSLQLRSALLLLLKLALRDKDLLCPGQTLHLPAQVAILINLMPYRTWQLRRCQKGKPLQLILHALYCPAQIKGCEIATHSGSCTTPKVSAQGRGCTFLHHTVPNEKWTGQTGADSFDVEFPA